ncbi:glycoside hydrolase N-terminal domain-containing protein [Haloferula sp. BvORR071]|uniref:glycoside hydrolase N-terminal domain-containing protein n=1 Tax=Haloferula sp. BvORR071 TaxID=1396141 RepID=UPI0005500B66|nr:glycoside hydrolase N-terminal domain-containing protein [Haloferula sp. BvORR071]
MRWPIPSLLIALLGVANGDEPKAENRAEITLSKPAEGPEKAFPIGNGELRARVKGRTSLEPMAIFPRGGRHPATPQVPGNAICGPAWFHFSLDWLAENEGPVTNYKRTLNLEDGTVVTTFNRGGAGFTWTVFATGEDGLIVTHLRTDKPGSLHFRVTLPTELPATLKVEDRRILTLNGKSGGKPFAARAWVYPMESEVTPGEKEITVRGEGEALILLAATRDPDKIATLPDRLKPLGFGGDDHPDVFQVWNGLLERHLAAHRKAMENAGETKQQIFNRYAKVAITPPEQLKPAEALPPPPEDIEFPPEDPADNPKDGEILPGKK